MSEVKEAERITSITLDDASILKRSAEIEHERSAALSDILHENQFAPVELNAGPYDLFISVRENRLRLEITSERLESPHEVMLPLAPLRSTIKDYFLICESYFEAVKTGNTYRVEAVDIGRRGIHNEGSELLKSMLSEKIALDFDTARRLFTLICVLHIK